LESLSNCLERHAETLGDFDDRETSQYAPWKAPLVAVSSAAANQSFRFVKSNGRNRQPASRCNLADSKLSWWAVERTRDIHRGFAFDLKLT
jgi:hypothetical protein